MTRLIIGAMVRAIGAYPSGWRYPGAHRDPRGDADVLRHAAQVAEAARGSEPVARLRPARPPESRSIDAVARASA